MSRFDGRPVRSVRASLRGEGPGYPTLPVPGRLLASADRLLWRGRYGAGTVDLGAARLSAVKIVADEDRWHVWTYDVTARDRDGAYVALTLKGRWWLRKRLPALLRTGRHGGGLDPIVVGGPDRRLRHLWPLALLAVSAVGLALVVDLAGTGVATTGTVVETRTMYPGQPKRERRVCVVDFVDPRDGRSLRDTTDCDEAMVGDVIVVGVASGPWHGRLQSSDLADDEFGLALAGLVTGATCTVRRSVLRRRMRGVYEAAALRAPATIPHRPEDR